MNVEENTFRLVLIAVVITRAAITATFITIEAFDQESNNIANTILYEDGSCIQYFENDTEVHFMHNITGPAYLYEDGEDIILLPYHYWQRGVCRYV